MTKPSFHLLGELERQIMDVVWKAGDATVRDVVEILQKRRDIAYTTVMTVMNRLVEKRVLTRKERSSAFTYTAAQKRESFFSRASSPMDRL